MVIDHANRDIFRANSIESYLKPSLEIGNGINGWRHRFNWNGDSRKYYSII